MCTPCIVYYNYQDDNYCTLGIIVLLLANHILTYMTLFIQQFYKSFPKIDASLTT